MTELWYKIEETNVMQLNLVRHGYKIYDTCKYADGSEIRNRHCMIN